ncbi:MAG: O-antigen ligase family protein [Hoeflea sp.]|nr:O-antigen ligase family protein [Hoeflea sp.]
MIQRIIDFLFRPDFEQFARVNIVFYCACLCAGAFIGSGIAVFVISGAVFGIFHFYTGRLRWSLPNPVAAVYYTFCGLFAAELISALIHPSMISLNEVIENLPFLGFAAIYAITVVDRKSLLRNVERAAAWAAIVAAVILAFIFDVNYRPELSAGNPSVLSLLAGILYVMLAGAAIRRNDRMMLFYVAAAACAAFVVIVTGTRSIWPALILIPILGLFVIRPMRQALLGSVAMMVVLVGLAGIGVTFSETLQNRVSITTSDIQSSFSGDLSGPIGQRLQIYRAGYELFLEKPLLGYGPGNERAEIARKTLERGGSEVSFSHAHNVLLNVALRAGTLGLLAFAALIIVPVVVVYRARRDDVAQAGFFILYGMLTVYLLAGAAGLMLGNDIHDAAFIAGVCYSLYLVFGRTPVGAEGSRSGPGIPAV